MLILALDTTTRAGSVAVTDDDTVLAVVPGDAARTHGERLPAEIEKALTLAGVTRHQLALLAVASGPGAFTGLRIGLAAMQGLAMVLGLPVVAVSALDALASEAWAARQPSEHTITAWMDAARGEVFAAQYDVATLPQSGNARLAGGQTLDLLGEPIVASPEVALAAIEPRSFGGVLCVGDGAARYRADIEARFPLQCRVIETPAVLAPAVARLGWRLAAKGAAGSPHALQPLYVRRPDAELERERRLDV